MLSVVTAGAAHYARADPLAWDRWRVKKKKKTTTTTSPYINLYETRYRNEVAFEEIWRTDFKKETDISRSREKS